MKTKRRLDELEELVMEAMVAEINECNSPVDSFKAIERYAAFTKARTTRMEGESLKETDGA